VADRGLAIGAGYTDYVEFLARLLIKFRRDFTHASFQIRYGLMLNRPFFLPAKCCIVPKHACGACVDGLLYVITAVRLNARVG
jgi:hypothetical protein